MRSDNSRASGGDRHGHGQAEGQGHRRSPSLTSPPPPPPDFNPPADISIDSALYAISPPSSNPSSSTASPGILPDRTLSQPPSLPAQTHELVRPELRALQRVSNESVGTIQSASSSFSSVTSLPSHGAATSASASGSEGGEHLAEMRERLLVEGPSASPRSRSDSESEGAGIGVVSIDLHIMSPTPPFPLKEIDTTVEAGPSRRSLGMSSSPVQPDLPPEHAWDSVWPTPGAVQRAAKSMPEAGPSRFPTAPVSPFVTPSFSPAVIQTSAPAWRPSSPRANSPSRSYCSPRASNSPVFDAWQPRDFPAGRRKSITSSTADLPIFNHPASISSPVPINKHTRSSSNSSNSFSTSPTQLSFAQSVERLQKRSPPNSPPRSPRLSAQSASDRERPASPATGKWQKKPASRLGELSTSTSNGMLNGGRSRGKSISSVNTRPPDRFDIVPSRVDSPRIAQLTPSCCKEGATASISPPTEASAAIPPVSLPPPAVTITPMRDTHPEPSPPGRDDGLVRMTVVSAVLPPPPLFAPLARPATLRRAFSDYDSKTRQSPVPPSLPRSSSLDEDKTSKRSPASADLPSPISPSPGADVDISRLRKSPKLTPSISPMTSVTATEMASRSQENNPVLHDLPVGELSLVDEGDVLPTDMDFSMDVTFEDEGLNTLERIFLLSKSEFPFHRAYIARVLGDLLYDVDPCESVEYVLPLINSFTLDEDESVKEAFAAELHRILWYFYSTCRVVLPEEEAGAVVPVHAEDETVTITSEGIDVVHRPTEEEIARVPEVPVIDRIPESMGSATGSGSLEDRSRRKSIGSMGQSSAGSSMTRPGSSTWSVPERGVDTPDSVASQDTVYSPATHVNPYSDDDPEKGWTKEMEPLIQQPTLPVDFFTPLLGALLLNGNTDIQESVRTGIVSLIGRLRGKGDMSAEKWGHYTGEVNERRVFASQNGPHSHDIRLMSRHQRNMVEAELLQGIVIGMGRLATEMPDHLFSEPLEDGQRAMEMYAEAHDDMGENGRGAIHVQREREAFQAQLIQEATAGRATSMNLIGALCEFYDGDAAVEMGFVEEVLRSGNGDVPVRAEGAVALSLIAKIAPVELVYRMIPLFEQLLVDDIPQVRQSACLSLPALCRRIESTDHRRSFATKAFRTLSNEMDEDVRCAALEVLGELIYVFHGDERGPPVELLTAYLDVEGVGKGLGEDWEVVASFNLPGVALTLGPDRWDELRELYLRLNDSPNPKVRRTLAASLHEFAKILREDQIARDLIPVYTRCSLEDDEIRELVFEHVEVFLSRLPLSLGWSTFLDLCRAWEEGTLGGWRARERLALHIPALYKCFGKVDGVESVLQIMRDALLDPFAAVRDAATKGIPESYMVLGQDSEIARKFREVLLSLSTSSEFRQRLTFVRCLREFVKPPPNRSAFEDFFLPALPRLSQDVVDVRLGLAQIISDLFIVGAFYADQMHVPPGIIQLAEALAVDDAIDVRDTVRNVDLNRLGKGKRVPFEIQNTDPPKRAVTPGQLDPLYHQARDEEATPVDEETDESGEKPSAFSGTPQASYFPTMANMSTSSSNTPPSAIASSHLSRDLPQQRPSSEVTAQLGGMRLTPQPLLSPALRGTVRGSGHGTPTSGEGHWISSPSPSAVPTGKDPFEASFGQATATPTTP